MGLGSGTQGLGFLYSLRSLVSTLGVFGAASTAWAGKGVAAAGGVVAAGLSSGAAMVAWIAGANRVQSNRV